MQPLGCFVGGLELKRKMVLQYVVGDVRREQTRGLVLAC